MALEGRVAAPRPSYRLIPSRFPPIGLFEGVARADDLEVVMELAGWTNDRLVAERIKRLPQSEWVFGRPNASIIMAAFLHAPPMGARFSGPDLGAWYGAARVVTAIVEVAHHLRRECHARQLPAQTRQFRSYSARIAGEYRDLRGAKDAALYASDSYAHSQVFGEALRASGEDGLVYDSVRHRGGTAICAYRPSKIMDVVQADHFAISVASGHRRIEVEKLSAP